MEWSNALCMESINLYEKHPVLWDPKHPKHKNRNSLNDAWVDIMNEFSIATSVDCLRKKKESLMATYRTLARKVRDSETTGSGASDVYVPSWFAYGAIDRFIRATGKKTSSLCSEEIQIEDEQDILDAAEQENESTLAHEGRQDRNQQRGNVTLAQIQNSPGNKRKVRLNSVEATITKHLKQAGEALTTLTTQSQTKTSQDAPALYGQLLAAKLRRQSEKTRLIVQNKIDNLLFEVELDEINRRDNIRAHSVTTIITSPNYTSPEDSNPSLLSTHASSSSTYVASPGNSAFQNIHFNNNAQSSGTSLVNYYAGAHTLLDLSENRM